MLHFTQMFTKVQEHMMGVASPFADLMRLSITINVVYQFKFPKGRSACDEMD